MTDHSDQNACADLVRAHDQDRWLTASIAPNRRRPALLALYAFNVEISRIPEIAHEPMAGLIRHQWWRESLDLAMREGRTRNHPVVRAMGGLLKSDDLRLEDVTDFLDAREIDLEGSQPEYLDAFEGFCRGTGGALCGMAARILVGRDAQTLAVAETIGTAHGMIGRLLNVPFWAARGRTILPRGEADAPHSIATRAKALLVEARERRGEVKRAAMPALLVGRIAEVRLGRLESCGFDPASPKAEPLPYARPLAVVKGAVTGRY
jgi:phytoene synthase